MRVLITAASRAGFAVTVAVEVGARLRELLPAPSASVDVRPMADVGDLTDYDAAVVGSAVYLGQWLAEARTFVAAHSAALAARPVWLFSGTSDVPTAPDVLDPARGQEIDIAAVLAAVSPVEHRVFAGHAVQPVLSAAGRGLVQPLQPPSSDFRDWAAVREWAAQIAATLTTAPAPATSEPSRTPRRA